MILLGFNFWDVITGMMWVTLVILIAYIVYKSILRRFSRGHIDHSAFCTLYNIEENPASGEIPFYFTSNKVRSFSLWILDAEMNDLVEVANGECKVGGNILRFDSSKLKDGDYFYALKTENQKVVKKMQVKNKVA